MRAFRLFPPFLLAAAALAAASVPAAADDCDYKLLQAYVSPHPNPNLIYLNFVADVEGTVSQSPGSPSQWDMRADIRYDGNLVDQHTLVLGRWATPNQCVGACPHVVCRHEDWTYKGVLVPQDSYCTLNAQNQCGCPPLGTPVVHQKPLPKPPGPVTIEIELVALSLSSCNPIRPENNKIIIPYDPNAQPSVPALSWPALTALILLGAGAMVLRRRSTVAS